MHRYKHLRRVADFTESLAGHFKDRKLRGRSEAVLYAAQKAVCTSVVSFKLKYHIDDMFQNLRSGDTSLLGDMAYQDYRDAGLLSEAQEHGGSLLDLCDGAGR